MLSNTLRRKAVQTISKRGFMTPAQEAVLMSWATRPIYWNKPDPDPKFIQVLKKEKFPTALILFTIGYISYAHARPHKDAAIWDHYGDLNLPIVSPILNYFNRKLGETVIMLPQSDAYADFSEEERLERMHFLDAQGFFDSYWQDQHDDFDKLRIMQAVTQKAIIRAAGEAYYFPQDNHCTIDDIRAMNVSTVKQPSLSYESGDKLVKIQTPQQRNFRNVLVAYDTLFMNHLDRKTMAAAYKFNTTPIPADVEAYEKMFGTV